MDSPLLSPRTEISETSEAPLTIFALPSDVELERKPVGCSIAFSPSLKLIPSNKQQYQKNPCIYRVPAFITKLNSEDYQPQVVSFGPYHYGEDHLLPMEKHKDRACECIFKRVRKPRESFIESIRGVAPHSMESYDVLHHKWKDGGDWFLEMMIRDGCFMLEIMRAWAAVMDNRKNDYGDDDPIFSAHRLAYMTPYIRRDMLLLENQLPMPVLYKLVAVESNDKEDDVNKLILRFCNPLEDKIKNYPGKGLHGCRHVMDVFREGLLMEPGKDQHKKENVGPEAGEGDESSVDTGITGMGHVVDVFREGLLMEPGKDQHKKENVEPEGGEGDESSTDTGITGMGHVMDVFRKCLPKKTENVEIIRSATELEEAGIRFEENKTRSLKEISFAGGVLKLPVITVDDTVKSMFLNVMTFERLHIGTGTDVTSYVIFMDNIINDEQDVALLHTKGIIQNAIGSNKAVAELFNSLCKEVTLVSNNSLKTVQKDISKYCEQPWNSWRANLNRTHFKNPWAILSLTAAIFLFVLTIIQTVYAMLSYY